jgi:hypothetical protein
MTYTVLINSDLQNSGTISNGRYFFDWDIFDDKKKYKVYIQFVSSSLSSTNAKVPSLYIDLGQGKSFRVNKTSIVASNSQFVGQLYRVETKTSPYLVSDANSKAIELNRRPVTKDFNVRILNDDGSLFASEIVFSYTIKLTFQEVDED